MSNLTTTALQPGQTTIVTATNTAVAAPVSHRELLEVKRLALLSEALAEKQVEARKLLAPLNAQIKAAKAQLIAAMKRVRKRRIALPKVKLELKEVKRQLPLSMKRFKEIAARLWRQDAPRIIKRVEEQLGTNTKLQLSRKMWTKRELAAQETMAAESTRTMKERGNTSSPTPRPVNREKVTKREMKETPDAQVSADESASDDGSGSGSEDIGSSDSDSGQDGSQSDSANE